ncbi:MAG: O-antigen ligase family protein [Flavobacteriales bacterium]|nr:O-antigen ligase family protein [Flavobacteriales bacterium]
MISLEKYNPANSKRLSWVNVVAGMFIALNVVLIAQDHWWLGLLPLTLIVALLWVLSLDKLLLLTVFLTPLSLTLEELDVGVALSLPSEPLMFGITLIFLIRQLFEGDYPREALKHPLTILILINLVWMTFTAATSEMPLVSFKYLIARIWFVVPFYFLALQLFKSYGNISKFVWAYIIPLILVIGYTTVGLWQTGFDEELSQSVMTPFYPSHTSYGAIIAMFLPFVIAGIVKPQAMRMTQATALAVAAIFASAILFSYSRAVWVSIPAAFGLFLVIRFKINLKILITAFLVVVSLLAVNMDEIIMDMSKNKQDSSEEFVENFQSISNITTDDSNTERLNRWSSAIAMFLERPLVGWGPGTYQFQYAPFQEAKNLTLISTNAGNLGNAHSEYIGPMAEGGLIAGLSILAIVLYFVYMGVTLSLFAEQEPVRIMALCILLGMTTYFVHGLLNNYLDIDKASVPFWGFMAIMTALDLYQGRTRKGQVKDLV